MWVRVILSLGLLSVGALAAAEDLFLGVERARIERVIEMGYGMDPAVEEEIAALAREFPESPVPKILELGYLYWEQNYKVWDDAANARFEDRAEAILEEVEDYYKEHADDTEARFAVALVELTQVLYYVDHHRWWAAFWKSRGSLKTMERLLELNPELHDAKLPLGMANCYLAKTPGYMKPLAFLIGRKGDYDEGIEQMESVRDRGLFCRVDGAYNLAGIYLDIANDRRAAGEELVRLVNRYPGNLKFRATLAENLRKQGSYVDAGFMGWTALSDERVESYPAIKRKLLVTLMWSAIGAKTYEAAEQFALEYEAFAAANPKVKNSLWVKHARAEALLGQGKREAAFEIWRELVKSDDEKLRSVAEQRLQS